MVFNEMAEGAFQFTMVAFQSADGEIKKWKGALLAVIIAGIFLPQKDDGTTLIAEWEKLAHDYQEGKLTLAEYRRGAEKLIKRSKNIRRKPCNRKWHTKPCGSK